MIPNIATLQALRAVTVSQPNFLHVVVLVAQEETVCRIFYTCIQRKWTYTKNVQRAHVFTAEPNTK